MTARNRVDVAIGIRVRKLRQRSGLSAADMASRLGIGADDLIQFEDGMRRIGARLLAEMASIFGVPVWSIFYRVTTDVEDDDVDAEPPPAERGKNTYH